MQTALADFIRDTPAGREADQILRACVHCGFCTATCPTYQLLGDELDGPRGRIYQIKAGARRRARQPTVREHLDRCLSCRSCETTCPSGVELSSPARHRARTGGTTGAPVAVTANPAAPADRDPGLPETLHALVAHRAMAASAAATGDASGRCRWPGMRVVLRRLRLVNARRVLMLDGCVQPGLAPEINDALEVVLAAPGDQRPTHARRPAAAAPCRIT